jgi:hypothetical protein
MKQSPWQLLGTVVGGMGALVTLVASFFVAGEDYYPGRFYIGLQALWDNNQYGVKYTFLLTWLTLLDVVVIPILFVAGAVAFLKRMTAQNVSPPPGWDVMQLGRRLKHGIAALCLLPLWLAVTGVVVFAPEILSPLGGFACIFLILLPTLPMVGPALLFEAAIAPRYVEGVIERLRVSQPRRNQPPTVHFHVGGDAYSTSPSAAQGLGDGMRVALVSSGFFRSVLRIARL